MYRKHFALTRHPFDKDLAADDLYGSQSLAELSARLKHLVDMRGHSGLYRVLYVSMTIGLVTGDSRSGKTPTCTHLVAGLRADHPHRTPSRHCRSSLHPHPRPTRRSRHSD